MDKVRDKWAHRAEFRKKNAELLAKLRRLAARNAELALEFLEKQKKR